MVDLSWFACKTTWWFAYTAPGMSVLIIVLLTLERLLMIKTPVFFRRNFSPKKAVVLALMALIFVAVLNSHLLFGFTLYKSNTEDDLFISSVTEIDLDIYPCYFATEEYRSFFYRRWNLVVLFLYNVCPVIVISTGNIVIACSLVRQKRSVFPSDGNQQESIANHSNETVGSKHKRRRSFTKILIVISCFFLFTTMPFCLYLVAKSRIQQVSAQTVAMLQLTEACIYCLMYCNFSISFIFYFMHGSLFRKELKSFAESIRTRLC